MKLFFPLIWKLLNKFARINPVLFDEQEKDYQ